MSQMNRSDYGPIRQAKNHIQNRTQNRNRDHRVEIDHRVEKKSKSKPKPKQKPEVSNSRRVTVSTVPSRKSTKPSGMAADRRVSISTDMMSQISTASTTHAVPIKVNKRSVSKKDPPQETIAIFGAYGVTGQHFLERAIEAGYNIQALIMPGVNMEDYACIKNLRLITGSLEEVDKIREVVENATYVVCLLNDCDFDHFQPPIGNIDDGMGMASPQYDYNRLNFMHNLIPILENSKTCRVMLYEVSRAE